MFKQEPPRFMYTANKSEFEEVEHETGAWVYGRKIEITLLPWQLGYYMDVTVLDLRSDLKKGNHIVQMFNKCIYDNKEMIDNWQDKEILAALAENQIRGNHAEKVIYALFLKYGKEILAEFFPLYYNYLKDNKVFGDL